MGVYFNGFSGIDFIWDRIQESRKNQSISYLILITGVAFFSGGFLETITSSGKSTWLLFIPYKLEPLTQNFVSMFILISGFMFSILGLSSCIYYKFDREYYFNLIKEDDTKQNKRFSEYGTKAFSKQLIKTQNELGACKIYLMNRYNQTEIDSISYCKLLGKHWHELVEEDKMLTNINA